MDAWLNLTSESRPKAPAIIRFWEIFVSTSDYGHEETRKLLSLQEIPNEAISQIMASRTLAKLGHAYKEEVVRRTWERYFDHPSGVMLLLLLELWETDTDILSAAALHDVLEDVKIDLVELKNAIQRMASAETLRITEMVTNPKKTGDAKKDKQIKVRHYHLISQDRKASFLKVADRMYNLRSLEIFQFKEDELTEKHLNTAKDQIEETREYILPIAQKYWLWDRLAADISEVEKRVSEVTVILLQKKTKESAKV